ncbi:Antibiotic biosynthesis monooxygenase [Pseudomonas aeruginosa]|nr:Antibiotic biosynthesis monooxygenase [Pseudomonas aeruginosa]
MSTPLTLIATITAAPGHAEALERELARPGRPVARRGWLPAVRPASGPPRLPPVLHDRAVARRRRPGAAPEHRTLPALQPRQRSPAAEREDRPTLSPRLRPVSRSSHESCRLLPIPAHRPSRRPARPRTARAHAGPARPAGGGPRHLGQPGGYQGPPARPSRKPARPRCWAGMRRAWCARSAARSACSVLAIGSGTPGTSPAPVATASCIGSTSALPGTCRKASTSPRPRPCR